jgi:hypothetical protein
LSKDKNPEEYAKEPSGLNPQYSPGKAERKASSRAFSRAATEGPNKRSLKFDGAADVMASTLTTSVLLFKTDKKNTG